MLTDLYHEYLYVVGKLQERFNVVATADHKRIHTFTDEDKTPLFKLLFGQDATSGDTDIVVTFHIGMPTPVAIQWFINIVNIHPMLKVHDVYIEDDRGEMYLGKAAEKIRLLKFEQDALSYWLQNHNKEEISKFVDTKILGRVVDRKQSFSVEVESEKAKTEFDLMKKPIDDGEVQ